MAPGKPATEFQGIINANRTKIRNEALAKEIFSKRRRQSAPSEGLSRKTGSGPSLASRIGVGKRTVSTTQKNAQIRSSLKAQPPPSKPAAGNLNSEWTHDLHVSNNSTALRAPQPRGAKQPRITRTEQLYNSLSASASSPALTTQFNVIGAAGAKKPISIKGLAGPYIVIAQNFARGTTTDDIESAFSPVGGVSLSCRILTESPRVIAEIIFESRDSANEVVKTFNNQNADGNVLQVYHKSGPAAKFPTPITTTPLGPRADRPTVTNRPSYGSSSDRLHSRQERRREFEQRAEVVDGSYGFEERMDTDDQEDDYDDGRLYSDKMSTRERERENTRDRVNERGRGFKR